MGTKDITEKQLADYNDVFADIINGILFGGEQVVLEHELQNARDKSQYKFDNTIHEQERDLSKHWIPHRICFALFGFEHQTAAEPYTPMRVIGYDGASYRGQLTKPERDMPKYPVITIVLYFGTKHWNQPRSLHQMCIRDRSMTTRSISWKSLSWMISLTTSTAISALLPSISSTSAKTRTIYPVHRRSGMWMHF